MLEEAGILSDRFRMPNKPPWDFEDFLGDDPEFLSRVVLYGLTRRSIYRHLREQGQASTPEAGQDEAPAVS